MFSQNEVPITFENVVHALIGCFVKLLYVALDFGTIESVLHRDSNKL